MLTLGNDIVDLADPDSDLSSYRSSFVDRVLHPSEKSYFEGPEFIASKEKFQILFWSIWSLKEAAYKALKRCLPQLIFSPAKFSVSRNLSDINFENFHLTGSVTHQNQFIHGIVYGNQSMEQRDNRKYLGVRINHLNDFNEDTPNPSRLVRRHLSDELMKICAKSSLTFEIIEKNNIPSLMLGNQCFPISYSHHGNFIASSFYLELGSS
jgi:phosphopantetheinyl transferase (holo-ACP synthase)